MSKLKREQSRASNDQSRSLEDAARQQADMKSHMNGLIREKAEADVELKTSRDRVTVLMEEVERLRRQIHVLQQDSADKDIKAVQLTKQLSQDKDDIMNINIALEAKQQELELVCFHHLSVLLFLTLHGVFLAQTKAGSPRHCWQYSRAAIEGCPSPGFEYIQRHSSFSTSISVIGCWYGRR